MCPFTGERKVLNGYYYYYKNITDKGFTNYCVFKCMICFSIV
jgi:hypothetical protein